MQALWHRLRTPDRWQWAFVGFVVVLLGGGAFFLLRNQREALVPALAVIALLLVVLDWRLLYYLLFLTLPFSMEIGLGSLSLDVPSEPLMLSLTACIALGLLLRRGQPLSRRELEHPFVLVLALMLLWSAFDIAFSVAPLKSVKYLLAKTWYLTPFLVGTLVLVRRPAQVWPVMACYVGSASVAVLYVATRHASLGFSFDGINQAGYPFFRNHVIYATLLALLLPFAWLGGQRAETRAARLAWRIGLGLLLFGLITSYTRASWLSVPVAGFYYLVLRQRLTRLVLVLVLAAAGLGAGYLASGNTFMEYAPNFERTVFNGKNFGKHLEATYKLEDVSGMERVYRWVAAANMIADKPLTGSGPATFYPEYKHYTVSSFRTYVSRNPEKSTTHNYFLLQLAEQGVPGFLLFLTLLSVTLTRAERLYHRARQPEHRRVVLAATLSLIIIIFHLLLNELIEVDKIGSVFFVCLALLMRAEAWIEEGLGGLGCSAKP